MAVGLGARTGALAGRDPEGDALLVLRTVGFPGPVMDGVRRQPLGMRSPLVECYETQAPVWVESREGPDGLDARWPAISPVWEALGVRAGAFLPLVAAGETVGTISFGFGTPRAFPPEERAFLLALGRQAALAVERARLFEAEHAARAEAERANRGKSEFLAVMSHELRTPLNAVIGYADLLQAGITGPLNDRQREQLGRIKSSSAHLLQLIEEILTFSRIEAGQERIRPEEADLDALLREAGSLAEPLAGAKRVSLVVRGPGPGAVLRTDPAKARQILLNLLSNAVKFTPHGEVELSGALENGGAVLRVRDTGVGIAPEHLQRIWEPFWQVEQSPTRMAEGTGLGLTVARNLAQLLGGEISVRSVPGGGSTFEVRLPSLSA
ncbi:MAG: GAF domain-containing sensor histidine kinase, partial [Longimicrobiaceae bacterium]